MYEDRIVELLEEIKDALISIDDKLDSLTFGGTYSLVDVCSSIDEVVSSIDNIDM